MRGWGWSWLRFRCRRKSLSRLVFIKDFLIVTKTVPQKLTFCLSVNPFMNQPLTILSHSTIRLLPTVDNHRAGNPSEEKNYSCEWENNLNSLSVKLSSARKTKKKQEKVVFHLYVDESSQLLLLTTFLWFGFFSSFFCCEWAETRRWKRKNAVNSEISSQVSFCFSDAKYCHE